MTFRPGCPIQKSQDQGLFTSSPGLIAGYHVFHRLLTPRHPSCALVRLIAPTVTPPPSRDCSRSFGLATSLFLICRTPLRTPLGDCSLRAVLRHESPFLNALRTFSVFVDLARGRKDHLESVCLDEVESRAPIDALPADVSGCQRTDERRPSRASPPLGVGRWTGLIRALPEMQRGRECTNLSVRVKGEQSRDAGSCDSP